MRRAPSDTPDRPTTRNLGPLLRLLGFVRPYLGRVVLAALALLVAAGSVLAFGQVIRDVVDSGLKTGSEAALTRSLLLFLGVVGAMAGAILVRSYLLAWIGERVVADLRRAVFDRVLGLDVGFFETTRTGEVISRLTSDTTLLQVVVGSTLAQALRTLLLVIGGVVMLALTSPHLTGLVLLGTPLVILPLWLIGHRVRRLSRASQDRIADVGAYVDEVLHAIRTVQAFCHEAVDRARYGERVESAFATSVRRARLGALLSAIAVSVTFGAIGVVLWIGGREVLAGHLSGGELSAFLFYAVLVASSVGGLSELVGDLLRGAGASERLMEILGTQAQIRAPDRPQPLPNPAQGRIEFRGLRFAYPAHPGVPVLHDLSLEISPGERVALVGPSGAGKTTLFQLLLRFYDPQQGSIRFDGVELTKLDPAELRRRIAMVPQDPVIFGADAWENIRYGMDVGAGRGRARRGRCRPRQRVPGPPARGLQHLPRRARGAPVRWPAPAHRHRPGPAARPDPVAARRGHQCPGRRERAPGPACPGGPHAGAHQHRHRPPPGHGAPGRPHPGPRPGAGGGQRRSRQPDARGRALCPPGHASVSRFG